MKRIKLTSGKYAIVDDWNYEWLNVDSWQAMSSPYTWYASRRILLRPPDYPRDKKWDAVVIAMHRQIMNPPADMEIDHANHNGLDNRECNLRICTHSQNMANSRKPKPERPTISKYKGLVWRERNIYRHWVAQITFNSKRIHIGSYCTEIEAARAYDKRAVELFGEFALTNFLTLT